MSLRRLVLPALAAATLAAAAGAAACGGTEDRDRGTISFRDSDLGISIKYPEGWYRLRALTNVVSPRELIALATYPLRGGSTGGGPCAAKADLEAIPPDGALVWLLEYRPLRGDVWAEVRRSSFPPLLGRIELARADLAPNSCLLGVGYAPRASGPLVQTLAFRAADRPLQLSLVFGAQVTDARLEEVEEILESLVVYEVPPPPADPYAGWPLVNDNPGDSLRPPPGWAATAAMFSAAETPRPRTLFFAANRPLPGLPTTLVPYVEQLPPSPSGAVANSFPADGVLVWVLEEEKGGPSGEYPAIDREWPAADFRPAGLFPKANPQLRWLRAGGSFRGYRFSVQIGAGPAASAADRELALKSAASLAVSGVCRDDGSDCPG